MTVSTRPYFSWSSSGINSNVAPYNACSPNLVAILAYLRKTWGGRSLGCHVPPPQSTKSHPYGAALDWSYLESQGGPGRAVAINTIAPFLIGVSAELGVNTIHDYITQRMWKPNQGWVSASIGDPGGTWFHIETTPEAFGDGRPVEDRLPGTPDETGDDFMTPEDEKWLKANVAPAVSTPSIEGWPDIAMGEAVGDTRAFAQMTHDKVVALDAQMVALVAASEAILAAIQGAEFPVSGTVHIGTE